MLRPEDLGETEVADRLKALAAASGWPYQLLGMGSADTFVVDREALDIVEGHRPSDGPALTLADDFAPDQVAAGSRIFVLAQSGECRLARQLAAQHPALNVVSVTYGYAHAMTGIRERVKRLNAAVLISSPSSGADYLTKLLEANKIARVCPGLDKLMMLWCQFAVDFSAKRRFLHLLETAKQSGDKKPVILSLELDQLELLTSRQLVTLKQFKDFSNNLNMPTVYLLRRSKSLQAASIVLRGQNAEQAASSMPSPESVLPIVLDLAYLETQFERFMSNLTDSRVITFEELLTNPVAVLSMLTLFMGEGTLRKAKIADPAPFDPKSAWSDAFQEHFKKFAEGFIGVSKNEIGSYAERRDEYATD